MTAAARPKDVDAYIAALPAPAAEAVRRLRAAIHAAAPGAAETIRYGMPAFQKDGATFLHLGAWTRHVGLYPVYRGPADFEAEVAPYRSGKDSVRFGFDEAPPEGLVARIVEHQLARR